MKPNSYKLIDKCVMDGIANGLVLAYQKTDYPTSDEVEKNVYHFVMCEIRQWFEFDQSEKP